MATTKTTTKTAKVAAEPAAVTGPTSGVLAPGAVGRAAREAARIDGNSQSQSLKERALKDRPILSGRGIDAE